MPTTSRSAPVSDVRLGQHRPGGVRKISPDLYVVLEDTARAPGMSAAIEFSRAAVIGSPIRGHLVSLDYTFTHQCGRR